MKNVSMHSKIRQQKVWNIPVSVNHLTLVVCMFFSRHPTVSESATLKISACGGLPHSILFAYPVLARYPPNPEILRRDVTADGKSTQDCLTSTVQCHVLQSCSMQQCFFFYFWARVKFSPLRGDFTPKKKQPLRGDFTSKKIAASRRFLPARWLDSNKTSIGGQPAAGAKFFAGIAVFLRNFLWNLPSKTLQVS